MLQDPALYASLKEQGIHLECCPTSSLLTKAVSASDGWSKHPIRTFVQDGMSIGINTDDPKVFDIDLCGEMEIAVARIGLTLKEIYACTINSINAAFCDEITKADLRAKVDMFFNEA